MNLGKYKRSFTFIWYHYCQVMRRWPNLSTSCHTHTAAHKQVKQNRKLAATLAYPRRMKFTIMKIFYLIFNLQIKNLFFVLRRRTIRYFASNFLTFWSTFAAIRIIQLPAAYKLEYLWFFLPHIFFTTRTRIVCLFQHHAFYCRRTAAYRNFIVCLNGAGFVF